MCLYSALVATAYQSFGWPDIVDSVSMLDVVPVVGSTDTQIGQRDVSYAAMGHIVSPYAKHSIVNACEVLDV